MVAQDDILYALRTGKFLKGVPFVLKRLSKSKLKQHDSCPRAFWFSQVLRRPERFPPSSQQNFARGRYVHRIHELFYKYFAANQHLLDEDPIGEIKKYFKPILESSGYPEYVHGICQWEMKKWESYAALKKKGEIDDIKRYFLPMILPNGSIATEMKIYSTKLDWVSIIDAAFWIPPDKKKKEEQDKILIVDDKTGRHKPSSYTALRLELTFMWKVAANIQVFGKSPELTAIFWPLSQDVLMLKPGKRQFDALDKRVDRLHYSIEHDLWPCNPGRDIQWSPCKWCPHVDICPQDLNNDYRFPPELEIKNEEGSG